jgi:hypothetical protein
VQCGFGIVMIPTGVRLRPSKNKGMNTSENSSRPGAIATRRWSAIIIGATAILLVLSWRGECWAYIDPNAGGFLAQILAPLTAIFLSFLFYCRKEIRRLVKFVRDRWKGIDSPRATDEVKK